MYTMKIVIRFDSVAIQRYYASRTRLISKHKGGSYLCALSQRRSLA